MGYVSYCTHWDSTDPLIVQSCSLCAHPSRKAKSRKGPKRPAGERRATGKIPELSMSEALAVASAAVALHDDDELSEILKRVQEHIILARIHKVKRAFNDFAHDHMKGLPPR